jgi:hypothetical protein
MEGQMNTPNPVNLEIQLNNQLAAVSSTVTTEGIKVFSGLSNVLLAGEIPQDYMSHRERVSEVPPIKVAA